MKKIISVLTALFFFLSGVIIAPPAQAASKTAGQQCIATHNIGPCSALEGWSPWLPVGYALFRYKVGIIASPGNINMKAPFMIGISYDDANAIPGSYFPVDVSLVRVESRNEGDNDKNLVADFGVTFPDKVEVGFGVGFPVIGSVGEWFSLPGGYGLWDIVGLMGDIGSAIAAASQVLGVNIREAFKPTLKGVEKKCTDTTELFNLTAADLLTGDATDITTDLGEMVNTIYQRIKSIKPSFISENTAKKVLGKGVSKFFSLFSFIVKGIPEYRWKGREVNATIRIEIPNLGIGQDYYLHFDTEGQTRTIKYFVPWNATQNDDVRIKLTDATYSMQLNRKLSMDLALPLFSWKPVLGDNLVFSGDLVDTGIRTRKPILASLRCQQAPTDFGGITVNPGMSSARVFWYTPRVAMKGKAQLYYDTPGGALVATVEEPEYTSNHSVIITGLSPQYDYYVMLTGKDNNGMDYYCPTKTAFKTKAYVEPRTDSSALSGSGPWVDSITRTSARVTWQTTQNADTEILYGPSPDYAATGKWIVVGGSTAEGKPLTIDHAVTLNNLIPGVTYYYSAVSWQYNQYGSNTNKFERAGKTFTTLPPPEPPSCYVRVERTDYSQVVGAPVTIEQGGNTITASTGTSGVTPKLMLEYGKSYVFKAELPAYHIKDNAAPSWTVPASQNVSDANRSLYQNKEIRIIMEKDASQGGYVWDARTGAAISGATVTMTSPSQSADTDSNGRYSFENMAQGTYPVTITKNGYFSATVDSTVDTYGLYRGGVTYLRPKAPRLNIVVYKNISGSGNTIGSCPISVKEGNGTLNPSATTVSDGTVTWSPAVLFSNDTAHTLKVTATPASGSGFASATEEVSLANGEEKTVYVVCPKIDNTGPVASDIVITRYGATSCKVAFNTDEQSKVTSAKLKLNTQVLGQSSDNNFDLSHNLTINLSAANLTTGQIVTAADLTASGKVEINLEDSLGNTSTVTQDLPQGSTPPNLSTMGIKKAIDNMWQDITTAEAGETVMVAGFGNDIDGGVVSQKWKLTGDTEKNYLGQNHIEWKLLTDTGTFSAEIEFKDDTNKTFTLSKEITVTERQPAARIISPEIGFALAGQKKNIVVEADAYSGLKEINVDWGDGKKEAANLSGEKLSAKGFSHAYSKTGKFDIAVTSKSVSGLVSAPVKQEVQVVNKPSCSLKLLGTAPYEADSEIGVEFSASGSPGLTWELKRNGTQVVDQGTAGSGELKAKTKQVKLSGANDILTLVVQDPSGVPAQASAVAVTGIMGRITEDTMLPSFLIKPAIANVGSAVVFELGKFAKVSKKIAGKTGSSSAGSQKEALKEGKEQDSGVKDEEAAETKEGAEQGASKDASSTASKTLAGKTTTGKQSLGSATSSTKMTQADINAKALQKETGKKRKTDASGMDALVIEWGDGNEDFIDMTGEYSASHAYSEAGNYAAKVMIGSRASGEWFKLTDGKVLVKDVLFGVEKESVSPDPLIPGEELVIKVKSTGADAGKWNFKITPAGSQTPVFSKSLDIEDNSITQSVATAGWQSGIYTIGVQAISILEKVSDWAYFPLVVAKVEPEIAIQNNGFTNENVNGIIFVPGFLSLRGGYKLIVDFGKNDIQTIELTGNNPVDRMAVSVAYAYKETGDYNITAKVAEESGAAVGQQAQASVHIVEKPAGAATEKAEDVKEEAKKKLKEKEASVLGIVDFDLGLKKGSVVTKPLTGAKTTKTTTGVKRPVSTAVKKVTAQ